MEIKVFDDQGHLGYYPDSIPKKLLDFIIENTQSEPFMYQGRWWNNYVRKPGVEQIQTIYIKNKKYIIKYEM